MGLFCAILPANNFPFRFLLLFTPSLPHVPHCLKKKAIPNLSVFSLRDKTHSSFIGLAFGPLSPPTITQSIFCKSISPKSESKGSQDRNFIEAFIFRK